jgi:hypothetical protein
MFGWWRRWRRTVARRKAADKKAARKKGRFNDWDETYRYGDPSDGAF